MTTIKESITNEIIKWKSIDIELSVINNRISSCYNIILIRDYDAKKKFFKLLHYLKMTKDYIYLKAYHNNIKKISSNEKLLNYFKIILVANGFDIEKIIFYLKIKKKL